MDAVVRTGGKQYRVHEGSVLQVATLDAEPGSQVELRDVLLVSNDGNVTVGSPTVTDAVVIADVLEHGRGKKVVNFKYKAKVRYRRKRGHRQGYTKLEVTEIRVGGTASGGSRRRSTAAATEEPVAEEAPVAEAPRRRSRASSGETSETAAPARRRHTQSSEAQE